MVDSGTGSGPTTAIKNAEYEVKLDVFEGPFDLLLHLVQKHDLDIFEIPIAEITHEYLAYLDLMKSLNLDVAGEFVVMAATLMDIKSRQILPSPEAQEEAEELRRDLAERLLEYRQYKEAARRLEIREAQQRDIFYRAAAVGTDIEPEYESTVFDLLTAFQGVLKRVEPSTAEVEGEIVTLEEQITMVRARLALEESVEFESLFPVGASRRLVVVTFLALLELVRLKEAVARQAALFGMIRIARGPALTE